MPAHEAGPVVFHLLEWEIQILSKARENILKKKDIRIIFQTFFFGNSAREGEGGHFI